MKRVYGWAGGRAYATSIKFSRMDSLPNFLTHGAPLCTRFPRARSSAINFASRRYMYFLEQGNVDDDATFITIFLVSFNLQSCCLMQSAVCSLQSAVCSLRSAVCSLRYAVCSLRCAVCSLRSAVCSLQSANVIHREETTLVFFRSWSRYFSSMCFSTNFQTSSCGCFVCFCLFSFDGEHRIIAHIP